MTIQEYIFSQMNTKSEITNTFICITQLVSHGVYSKDTPVVYAENHYVLLDGGCANCEIKDKCILCQINEQENSND